LKEAIMCQVDNGSSSGNTMVKTETPKSRAPTNNRPRRGKRDKEGKYVLKPVSPPKKKKPKKSKALLRHGKDAPSGGIEALVPSLIGLGILVISVMAQRGFRGRASVAGIDLGTTNSVICVQAPSKSVGEIDCIQDPITGSPIIPSVVAFLQPHERKVGPSSKIKSNLVPHPSHVVVGQIAKQRIDSHPHHTLYNAKRVLGRSPSDPAIKNLRHEVEFSILDSETEVAFLVDDLLISPEQVGSYVVHHLIQITKSFLGHENVKSAVLAVPAKFDQLQRQRTVEAFRNAGISITRVLEEPAAAALAYGLHKKEGVEKILVYDFGGGTLDVSVLHVSDGYCEVIGSDGDDRLGGADFDAAVAGLLAKRHAQVLSNLASYEVDAEELPASCSKVTDELPLCSVSSFHTLGEQLKISLSSDGDTAHAECLGLPPTDGNAESVQLICDQLSVQPLSLSLADYDKAVNPLFERSILPVTRLLKDLTLRPDEIDEIVMVGGTTRMPQIRELVREAFSSAQLNTHIDPDITVAYGAASVID
jgi:molecular chaperone DnaK (HSP70)